MALKRCRCIWEDTHESGHLIVRTKKFPEIFLVFHKHRKNNKSAKTHHLLGCTFEELKMHLESQFVNDMSWDNMGKWHIDHIVPLAAFDLTKEENQKLAFHHTNLQPLWAIDNLKKGAKYG